MLRCRLHTRVILNDSHLTSQDMKQRIFDIRLCASYEGTDNSIATLDAEILQEDEWLKLTLDTLSPGFLLLCYGISSCQHMYFRTNAAERNLVLASCQGRVRLATDEDWHIQQLHIQFEGILRDGLPTQ